MKCPKCGHKWQVGTKNYPIGAEDRARLVDKLVRQGAIYFGLEPQDVTGKSRVRRVLMARHSVWAILRFWGWTSKDIGDQMGFDHTTILSAMNRNIDCLPLNEVLQVEL